MARYALRGTLTATWVPSPTPGIATPASPGKVAELDHVNSENLVGTSNEEAMADLTGFELQGGTIPTPDLTSFQTGKIPGEVTIPDGTMDFYVDDSTFPIFTALAAGSEGYVVFGPKNASVGTWTATDVTDVFPATVTSRNRMYSSGNEAHKFRVVFALGVPTLNGAAVA